MQYVSIKGGSAPVNFETAILQGLARDGGLLVPQTLPHVTQNQLISWSSLSYTELAFEILSLFIDRETISATELTKLLSESYKDFEAAEIIPLYSLKTPPNTVVMELFHGPTQSFKDIGLAFVINLVNFFLERNNERLSLIVATTGDTGPATAYFAAGKPALDAWVLYPSGLITEQQERQMTTLPHSNVHPVSVKGCSNGGDDLDEVISALFANNEFKHRVKLSSVNSINWGRVMMQTVHYFYGYFQTATTPNERVNFCVPSGGFGNLCAGTLAKRMGLPVALFVSANNENDCLHQIFSQSHFSKQPLLPTVSSAIDILIPTNFWRYLYFVVDGNASKIRQWIQEFDSTGTVNFDEETARLYTDHFLSYSASDQQTMATIRATFEEEGYLLDPHAAVALTAINHHQSKLKGNKTLCLATAHPAKFPDIIQKALGEPTDLPVAASHNDIEKAKAACQRNYRCEHANLEQTLIRAMTDHWNAHHAKAI